MNNKKSIKSLLAGATIALLANTAQARDSEDDNEITEENSDQEVGEWKFDAAFLYYGESDSRVTALEPVFKATKLISDDESVSYKLTVDSLTGATPSGAVASNEVQTVTSSSGGSTYEVSPGAYPLDDTFFDTRYALAANWSFPMTDLTQASIGGNYSQEYDYTSISVNANISSEFNNRNTTWFAGISYAADTIDPVGGIPIPLTRKFINAPAGTLKEDDKDVVDLLFGFTQVVSRFSLFQLNFSFSQSDGYHNDAYKVVSVIGADGNYFNDGFLGQNVLFENRPDSRSKESVFTRLKSYVSGDILDLSYRYMSDDWDITSHTVDIKYRFTDNDTYWQPHLRYYNQTEANFYRPYILRSDPVPTFASADYRLAEYDAITAGVEFGWKNREGNQWRLAFEYYIQTPTEPEKFGALNNITILPEWSAAMVRINYSF